MQKPLVQKASGYKESGPAEVDSAKRKRASWGTKSRKAVRTRSNKKRVGRLRERQQPLALEERWKGDDRRLGSHSATKRKEGGGTRWLGGGWGGGGGGGGGGGVVGGGGGGGGGGRGNDGLDRGMGCAAKMGAGESSSGACRANNEHTGAAGTTRGTRLARKRS